MESAKAVDLRPNGALLDPKFEGYKLNLDPLPTYKLNLPIGPDQVKLRDDQYAFQHVKAFGTPNHLILDPWNRNTVYYISRDWSVMRTTVEMDTNLEKPVSVFQIPTAAELKMSPHQNVSLQFPAEEWAMICDGTAGLLLIQTGVRSRHCDWKICYSGKPVEGEIESTLVDSILYKCNDGHRCDCILLHIREKFKEEEDESKVSHFETVLEWITLTSEWMLKLKDPTPFSNRMVIGHVVLLSVVRIFECSPMIPADSVEWSVERTRQLVGASVPDLVTIAPEGSGLYLSSAKPFTLKFDSVKPVQDVEAKKEEEEEKKEPAYTWYQTLEDLNIDFTLPEGVDKHDVQFELKADYMRLCLTGGKNLLTGKLHALVDTTCSTWTIEGRRLEVFLVKQMEEMWQQVVIGDDRGEMVIEPEEAAKIHEKLAHLTTDSEDSGTGRDRTYNMEGLEECDAFPDDNTVMVYFDAEANRITHKTFLGIHQWLFNVTCTPGSPQAICLRHDVDGLLWQPKVDSSETDNPWEHVKTFNALGYVTASKMDKKFASCAPSGSFAVICDCVRHLYVYRQPAAIVSPLRNRKTGEQIGAVAKQQVASLDSVDTVLGMQVTDERVFVMTDKALFVVRVNTREIL